VIKPLEGKGRDAVALATRRFNIWEGSVRSGKTVGSLLAWLLFVRQGPPGNLIMIGKTERTLKRNIIDELINWLGKGRCRYVAGSGELHICGRMIYLAGANDEKAQEKIRGMTLVGAYVDELSLIPESMMNMLTSRLSVTGARLYATTNPDSPGHWLLRDYLSRAALWIPGSGRPVARRIVEGDGSGPMDMARFSFTIDDNPHLDPVYVANIKREYVGLWYKRFILGQWVAAEGSVWPQWDPDRHVAARAKVPHIRRWISMGVDYGTTNPFAALLIGLGDDGRLWVTDEFRWDSRTRRQQLSDVEYSARLRQWMAQIREPGQDFDDPAAGVVPEVTVVDPSAGSMRVQLYRDGITTTAADNTVGDGLRMVGSLMAADQLRIADTCTALIDEIPGYVWCPKATARGEDTPIKLNDHSCDALRYGLYTTRGIWAGLVRAAAVSTDRRRMAA